MAAAVTPAEAVEAALSKRSPSEAYVTLVASDGYAVGACVLAHSLRRTDTKKDLVAMVTAAVSVHTLCVPPAG